MKDNTQDRQGFGTSTHRIDEMVFDLVLAPGVGGPADADALGWAVRSELLSPIEEVLETCGLDCSIKVLEIDLGHHALLDFGAMRADLRQRLQLALEAASVKSPGAPLSGVLPVARAGSPAGAAAGSVLFPEAMVAAHSRSPTSPFREARNLALALAKAVMTDAPEQAMRGLLQSLHHLHFEAPASAARAVADPALSGVAAMARGESVGAPRGGTTLPTQALDGWALPGDPADASGDPSSAIPETPPKGESHRSSVVHDDLGRPSPEARVPFGAVAGTRGHESRDNATEARASAGTGPHRAAGSAEPWAGLAEAGAALLAIWRSDPLALAAAVAGADLAALHRLRAAARAAESTRFAMPAPGRAMPHRQASVTEPSPPATPETILAEICSMVLAGSASDTPDSGETDSRTRGASVGVANGPKSPGIFGRQDQEAPSAGQAIAPTGAVEHRTATASAGSAQLPRSERTDSRDAQNSVIRANEPASRSLSDSAAGALAGAALIARWRATPAAALALFAQSNAAALRLMLLHVLPLDDQGRPPPLVAAVEDRFARHPDAVQALRAVLRQILHDAPIDFDLIEAEIAAAASAPEASIPALRSVVEGKSSSGAVGAGDATGSARSGLEQITPDAVTHRGRPHRDPGAGADNPVVPPTLAVARAALLALLSEDGLAETASVDDPKGEAIAALARHHGGLLSEVLGHPTEGLARTVRLLALLPLATIERLIAGLDPGLEERDLEVIAVFWAAMPGDVMLAPLSEPTRWRFALVAADGGIPRWGGVEGLVERVLVWLAPEDPEAFAARLAAVFDFAPLEGPAAARIRIREALREFGAVEAGQAEANQSAAGQPVGNRIDRTKFGAPAPVAPAAPGEMAETETLLTEAAGLVLLAPWLPMLFDRLGCIQDAVLTEPDRAMDSLWNVLHGDGPTPALAPRRPLERILCAIPEGVRLRPPERVEAETAELVESMLTAVLDQWRAVGQTSVEGLRASFLRREGLLHRDPEQVVLSVAPKAFDMLVDRVPWGFRLLKYPWMDRPVHVNWRNNYG